MYAHRIKIIHLKESYYDDNIGDHVITMIRFILQTLDLNSGNSVSSNIINLPLPQPDLSTFVNYNDVNNTVYLNWIDQNYDVIALQNENIAKLSA